MYSIKQSVQNSVFKKVVLTDFDFAAIKNLKQIHDIEKVYQIGYVIDRGDI